NCLLNPFRSLDDELMSYKIKADGECSVAVREQRCTKTARRNLQCNIPEMVHARRQCQRDLTDDLCPHVQCGVGSTPRFQRKPRPTGLVLHVSIILSDGVELIRLESVIITGCTHPPICWCWDLDSSWD